MKSKLIKRNQKGSVLYNSNDPDFNKFILDVSRYAPNLANYVPNYNMYRYWELSGKPKNFFAATQFFNNPLFTFQDDGHFHAGSVAYDKDNDRYEFMKSKNHPTRELELKWFRNGPDKMWDGYYDWKRFKNDYEFVEEIDKQPAMYKRK